MREKYESLSLTVLKELAKARGMRGISAMKKGDLIAAMLEQDEKDRTKKMHSRCIRIEQKRQTRKTVDEAQSTGVSVRRSEEIIRRMAAMPEGIMQRMEAMPEGIMQRMAAMPEEKMQRMAAMPEGIIQRMAAMSEEKMQRMAAMPEGIIQRMAGMSEEKIQRMAAMPEEKMQRMADMSEKII